MSDTPKTDAVARQIGKLAYELALKEISLCDFSRLAQKQLDKLATIERENMLLREHVKRWRGIWMRLLAFTRKCLVIRKALEKEPKP